MLICLTSCYVLSLILIFYSWTFTAIQDLQILHFITISAPFILMLVSLPTWSGILESNNLFSQTGHLICFIAFTLLLFACSQNCEQYSLNIRWVASPLILLKTIILNKPQMQHSDLSCSIRHIKLLCYFGYDINSLSFVGVWTVN